MPTTRHHRIPCRVLAAIAAAVLASAFSASAEDGPRLEPTTAPSSNTGLRVVVGEPFVNRLLANQRVDRSPVRDFVMGAVVRGRQQTTTHTTFDLLPCGTGIRFDVRTAGITETDTVGFTPQAAVRTLGRTRFDVSKPILFNGRQLLTARPTASLKPMQQSVAATTRWGRVPLIGPLIDQQALVEANRRRPTAEAVTAERMAAELLPEFDRQIDARLVEGNTALASAFERLERREIAVPSLAVSSTDEALLGEFRLEGVAASAPPPDASPPGETAAVALHESFVSAIAAQLKLGGREFAPSELIALGRRGSEWFGIESPADEGAEPVPDLATIVLIEDDPVEVAFREGEIRLAVRFRIKPTVAAETAPHEIGLTVRPRVRESDLVLEPDPESVAVVNLAGEKGIAAQATVEMIRLQVAARLQPVRVPRVFHLPGDEETGRKAAAVALDAPVSKRGWLVLRVRPVDERR